MKNDKAARFSKLNKELLNDTNTPLFLYRRDNGYAPVLGEGNLNASVVFIGEAPGRNEGETGKPFIGAAGKMLTRLLHEIHILRNDIFITSVVHDRPPNNRKPTNTEIEYYSTYLMSVLSLIQPSILVTLGNTATRHLFSILNLKEKPEPILTIHGKPLNTTLNGRKVAILPALHPAAVLYQRKNLPLIQKDFQVLLSLLQSRNI